MKIFNPNWVTLSNQYHREGSLDIGEMIIQLNPEYTPSLLIEFTREEFTSFKLGILGFVRLMNTNPKSPAYYYKVGFIEMRYDNRGDPYSQGLTFEVEECYVYIDTSELRRYINDHNY